LPIADWKTAEFFEAFSIGNWKLEIENVLADGRPAPAHIKLGAKWVEVRKRREPGGEYLEDEERI
jgi:hypothetical protein